MKKKKIELEFTFTKNGEPFVMPDFDESAWNENLKRWKKILKQMENAKKAMEVHSREQNEKAVKEWQKYGVTITDPQQIWEEISQRLDAGKEFTRDDFNREFPAIRAYLEGKNLMLPTDAEQFLTWFIFIKYRKRPFGEMIANWPKIELPDFREFHTYKEHLFKYGGKVGDYPLSWQKVESMKNGEMPHHITMNEKLEETSDQKSNKAGILKLIEQGYLQETIEYLKELAKDIPDLYKDAVHLLGRWRKNQKDFNLGVISPEQHILEENRIRKAALDLTNELQ